MVDPSLPPLRQIPEGSPLPQLTEFYTPLLIELGLRTELVADKGVPVTPLIEAILRRAGYDPNNLPPSWTASRWSTKSGIFKKVIQTSKHARARRGWLTSGNRGQWALTPVGVAAARPLVEPLLKPRPNLTSQWFSQHLTPQRGQGGKAPLMIQMEAALRRHLPLSCHTGQIEDHVQTYIMRAIKRDAFARHLQEGKLTYGKVVSYCVNSGRTDARDMGTDPVCRELYGARTEVERRNGGRAEVQDDPAPARFDTDGNPVALSESMPEMSFDAVWARIEQTVLTCKPKAGERYAALLRLKVAGYSLEEIAQIQGVSRNRTASMLADVRRMLREEEVEEDLPCW